MGLVGKAGKLWRRRHSEENTWVAAKEPWGRMCNHDVYVDDSSRGEGMSEGNVEFYRVDIGPFALNLFLAVLEKVKYLR